jgi:thymidylate kinase
MKEGPNKIISIAFEGMHRTGKGVQMELLKNKLEKIGVLFVDIRGEGSRAGNGKTEGDPNSEYWIKLNEELHSEDGINNFELWDKASYRLAREFLVWRDRVLKNKIENSLSPFGVLVVDRSLVSNASLKNFNNKPSSDQVFTDNDLYRKDIQKTKKITPKDVLPDIIIELIAPKDVLISRLDKNDPKYEFRKNNIEEKYDTYLDTKSHLEKEILDKIVSVDSSREPEKVFEEIGLILKKRFPNLLKDNI